MEVKNCLEVISDSLQKKYISQDIVEVVYISLGIILLLSGQWSSKQRLSGEVSLFSDSLAILTHYLKSPVGLGLMLIISVWMVSSSR